MMTFTIEELKKMEAEEIQEKVARHLCKLMDDEWKLGRKLYMDTAKEILDDIALPELLKALETPVAWRWKPTSSSIWIYDPSEDWLNDHWDDPDIDLEPLFALPPHGGVDVG